MEQLVDAAQRGDHPRVVCRVASGWVVLAEPQFLRGYCLVVADPVVASLNAMPAEDRGQFLVDMAGVGDALLVATSAARINYSILGNADPGLHAHVFARYDDEPDAFRRGPVWAYDRAERASVPFDAARDAPLMAAIRSELERGGLARAR